MLMRRGLGKRVKATLVAFSETFELAFDALRAHKLRSLLTLIGVILAVMTLVAVMRLVDGPKRYLPAQIPHLRPGAFFVGPLRVLTSWGASTQAPQTPPLPARDSPA